MKNKIVCSTYSVVFNIPEQNYLTKVLKDFIMYRPDQKDNCDKLIEKLQNSKHELREME